VVNHDDELGAELRRLFDDERLAIRPAPEAGDAIVAGARMRRRRRRTLAASGGVLTAAVLVTVGLVVGGPDPVTHEAALPTTVAPSTTTTAPGPVVVPPSFPAEPPPPPTSGAPVPTSEPASPSAPATSGSKTGSSSKVRATTRPAPAITAAVLGPDGYRTLRLGMSFADAKATGMLADADSAPAGCAAYRLTEGTANVANVTISPSGGVVAFTASGARTPENVGAGSTVTELKKAYPDLAAGPGNYSTATGSGDHYTFYVSSDGVVVNWELVAAPDC